MSARSKEGKKESWPGRRRNIEGSRFDPHKQNMHVPLAPFPLHTLPVGPPFTTRPALRTPCFCPAAETSTSPSASLCLPLTSVSACAFFSFASAWSMPLWTFDEALSIDLVALSMAWGEGKRRVKASVEETEQIFFVGPSRRFDTAADAERSARPDLMPSHLGYVHHCCSWSRRRSWRRACRRSRRRGC